MLLHLNCLAMNFIVSTVDNDITYLAAALVSQVDTNDMSKT